MKKLITLLFLLCLGTTYAQVGIGTPLPNGSSQLDVVANDKGMLIPRISLTSSTDATTISNGNVFSLLVFNTSTIQGDISPGYHYWDGSKWQRITNADDVVTLIEVNETLTSISQDIDAGTITYIDEDGGVTVLDIAQIIDVNETLTSLTDNGDGTITYIDEDGAATIIDLAEIIDNFETITNLVDNGDGTITYTNEEGTNQTINIEDIIDQFETVTTMVQDDTTGDITYTDEDGNPSVADIISDDTANIIIVGPDGGAFMDQAIIQNNETLTILELLIDGSTLQYTDEEGGITQIDLASIIDSFETLTVLGMNADGINLDYQDENGDITQVDLGAVITANETLTILVDNNDGTITYTDENGDDTVIDIATIIGNYETVTNLVDNGDGTITYTNEEGTNQTVDIVDIILQDIINQGDIYNEIINIITANTDIFVDNGDGTFTHTAADGTVVVFDANTTTMTNNGDGTYTFTNDNGDTITVDVIGDVVTNIQNQGDIYNEIISVITANTDIFVDNGDGTFTHTAADGTVVVFDANTTTMINNGDGTYTFTNDNGDTITVDVIGDVVTNIQNQGDIYNEIINVINANTDVFVDNGDGTFTHTAADGTVVVFDANTTTMINNGDGTYTFTNDNGDTITVDVIGDVVTNIQNQGDIYNEIINVITANTDVFVDNGDGTFTHTAADGTVVVFDANTTTMINNGDGTYTFTNDNGDTITVDVIGDVVTNIQNQGDIYNEIINLISTSIEAIRTETASYSILADDGTILIDATAGSVIVTLPTPVLGKKYVVKKIDATVNSMVLNGGGATIDGATTRTTTVPYQAFVLQNDGTNWFIIN